MEVKEEALFPSSYDGRTIEASWYTVHALSTNLADISALIPNKLWAGKFSGVAGEQWKCIKDAKSRM